MRRVLFSAVVVMITATEAIALGEGDDEGFGVPLSNAIIVPDDYPTIQEAVDQTASSVGADLIGIRPGTYTGDVCVDSQTVVFVTDPSVEPGSVTTQGRWTIKNQEIGEFVVIRGINFERADGTVPNLEILDSIGFVWLEDCNFQCDDTPAVAGFHASVEFVNSLEFVQLEETFGLLTMVECQVEGSNGAPQTQAAGGAGIRASYSVVTLHECEVTGGFGAPSAMGGEGVSLDNSNLFVGGGLIVGGDGGDGDARSCVGGDGGDAVQSTADDPRKITVMSEASLVGGAPGSGSRGCSDGAPGQGVSVDANTSFEDVDTPSPILVVSPAPIEDSLPGCVVPPPPTHPFPIVPLNPCSILTITGGWSLGATPPPFFLLYISRAVDRTPAFPTNGGLTQGALLLSGASLYDPGSTDLDNSGEGALEIVINDFVEPSNAARMTFLQGLFFEGASVDSVISWSSPTVNVVIENDVF